MRLRKLLYLTIFTGIIALNSCAPSPSENAQELINQAKHAFSLHDETQALTLIDSLHATYPTCVSQRRTADTLEWAIEKLQIERSLPYLDSILVIRQNEFPELKKQFRFEKDEKYQDIGDFTHSLLRTESNTNRCYLKPYTNENGDFLLMSYYVGGTKEHNTLTATIGENKASTLAANPEDINRYENLGSFHETILFTPQTVNNIHQFIANNYQEKVKIILSLDGENNKYIYSIFENERKIFADTYQLATCINDIKTITEQQNTLNRKLSILNNKLNNNTTTQPIQNL